MDRVLMWEMSQMRRRDLLESAGVARRRTGIRCKEPSRVHPWATLLRVLTALMNLANAEVRISGRTNPREVDEPSIDVHGYQPHPDPMADI
jgi:hypothetical protein